MNAAALIWKVDPARLVARDGKVVDPLTGKSLGYGALVGVAATLPMPKHVALKDRTAVGEEGMSAGARSSQGTAGGTAAPQALAFVRVPARGFNARTTA